MYINAIHKKIATIVMVILTAVFIAGCFKNLPLGRGYEEISEVGPDANIVRQASTIVACAGSSYAIKSDNSLWAWGSNSAGQLGDGTTENQLSPVKIMEDVIFVTSGGGHAMAITSDGTLWAWGWNRHGQLGDGTTERRLLPTKIMESVVYVSSTTGSDRDYSSHTMAIQTDGSLWAWGNNQLGQLGDGSRTNRHLPVKVMDDVAVVLTSFGCTSAIRTDGTLWTWGSNSRGQLGDGTSGGRRSPGMIMEDVAFLSSSMVIKNDWSLWGWGRDIYNMIGVDAVSQQFPPIELINDIKRASTEWGDILIFEVGDRLMGFGENHFGSLGLSDSDRFRLRKITGVIAVSVGGTHTLAITYDGELWAWGRSNMDGRLGNDLHGSRQNPLDMPARVLTDMLFTGNSGYRDKIAMISDIDINYRTPSELGDDFSTFNVRYAGDLYTLPVPLSAFIDNGWEIIDARKHVEANYRLLNYRIMFNDQILSTTLTNFTDSIQPVENCFVMDISFRSYSSVSNSTIEIPGGITEASSREDVIEAYGLPDDRTVINNSEFLIYGDRNHGISFTINMETDRITRIDVSYTRQSEDSIIVQVTAEIPDAVINYRTPAELGDDFNSFNVRYAGDLYTLPVPLSVFLANGWEIIDTRTHVAGNAHLSHYEIKFNDQILSTILANYSGFIQPVENCFVMRVTFCSSRTNLPIELPGGITESSTLDDVIKAYGQPYSQSVVEIIETLRYGGISHGIRFSFNIETGRIFNIQVNHT